MISDEDNEIGYAAWYDMKEKLEKVIKEKPKRRFSISELALAIDSKIPNVDGKEKAINYLKKNGSDIISRLKAKLDFDVEPHKDDTDEVKFEKLKLLKLICIAEKYGEEKIGKKKKIADCYMEEYTYKKGDLPKYKMPLIDIIAEPSLSYVDNSYSKYAIYKAEFDRVVNIVRKYAPESKAIENELNRIHNNWKRIVISVYCDSILQNSNTDTESRFVNKEASIRKTLEKIKGIPVNSKDSIVNLEKIECSLTDRFYILLLTAKIRAELIDYHKLRRFDSDKDEENTAVSETDEVPDPNQEYLDRYLRNADPGENLRQQIVNESFYNTKMTFEEFSQFIGRGKRDLENFYDDEKKLAVWRLILLKEQPDVNDIKELPDSAYDFALKYTEKMTNMWQEYETKKPTEITNAVEKYAIDTFCVVFRELLYIFLKNESIDNKHRYAKNKTITMTAAVKNKFNFNALLNMILIKHFQDRLTLMYSSQEVIECRQEIDKHIFDIEENIMRCQTLEEIIEADRIISFVVALNSQNEELNLITHSSLTLNTNGFNGEYNIYFNDNETKRYFFSALVIDKSYRYVQNPELCSLYKRFGQLNYELFQNFDNDKIKEFSALINKIRKIPKPITIEDEIINIFYSYMSEKDFDEVQTYDCQINICFQERTDYKMYFMFEIDRSKKIITVTSCTFDDDIQQILKKCNIK